MGDEAWANIQLVKNKTESFREKLKKRKAERENILNTASGASSSSLVTTSDLTTSLRQESSSPIKKGLLCKF